MFTYDEEIKNLAEALAIAGAFLVFLFWFFMGSLFPPLKMSLGIQRTPLSSKQTQDFVNVMITLENPGRGSMAIELVEIRIRKNTDNNSEKKQLDLSRCTFNSRKRVKLDWDKPSPLYGVINLAPGDSTQVGDFFVVSSQDTCIIESVVVASIPFLRFLSFFQGTMQWRASGVSPPTKAAS